MFSIPLKTKFGMEEMCETILRKFIFGPQLGHAKLISSLASKWM